MLDQRQLEYGVQLKKVSFGCAARLLRHRQNAREMPIP